ncbi:uncharacterized protein LOC129294368 [Prosopis cineraria]|uniref:uncharacterized protein LOC129294368 n=1 Tax=Prosopis cineraria TaxID=364024 RepID=UPI00240E9F9E|nr:uncharacterized protein LOC129294368 [Prosopis cineraria]
MQPQQSSRIDLGEIKAQMVKRIGGDKSKRYFYYLNKFLSQKLSKNEFDKFCYRLLGRENLPLHNHFMRSILKNACQAKTSPPIPPSGPLKSGTLATTISPGREDGHEHSSSSFQNQSQNVSIWSNGVFPVSPRKMRSGIRDRKNRDRPSPLGPNGKVDSISHQSLGTEDSGSKVDMENGILTPPCDYQRPVQQLQAVAELPESERRDAVERLAEKARVHGKGLPELSVVEDGEEVEQSTHLSRRPLLAPLGIPYHPASEGGARRALPVVSMGDFLSCYDSGWLSDTETLRRRMEQITTVQGLGGVSMECANMLNNMLDVYLKRLIRSCVGLVEARSANEPRKTSSLKQQIQGKVINGLWPSNNLHVQSAGGSTEPMLDRRPPCLVSPVDFKVAMELNPQQLGEDWPLLLEKISMHTFEE